MSILPINVPTCAAVTPTITEVPDDTVGRNPVLTVGQDLTLTCSAMGTPRPQISWFRGDSRIVITSRTHINETEIGADTLVSMLVISSVTEDDSGTYECRVDNDAGTTSQQYSVLVGEWVCLDMHSLCEYTLH